jgi:hypothetical protein
MNNTGQLNKRYKWLTKRLLRFVAFVSLAIGGIGLITGIKIYVNDAFLKDGATINPEVVKIMIGMIKDAFFWIIPGISVLSFVNGLLLWMSSKNIYPDEIQN